MNAAARAVVCLLIIGGADALTLTPAAFSARYRTPRRVIEALVIATVSAVALITVVTP